MIKMKRNSIQYTMKTGLIALGLSIILFVSCKEQQQADGTPGPHHPTWSVNAVLYEVNIRQYTPEGTFRAFLPHLDRLDSMGIDLVWFMPIYPIGQQNRKGTLGSYYSIRDYTSVNPDFGTLDDFKAVVNAAHEKGMHVLLDWVANHTAWDHTWTTTHPEWYDRDSTGNFLSPYDWTDVIQLNYDHHDLWKEMVNAMKYWVKETGIDGFRCDYPGHIPVAFWDSARKELEKIKPVFMLAEDEGHNGLLDHAFDMNYGWEFMHLTEEVARGDKNAADLANYFQRQKESFPYWAYKLYCLTNHDENSWSGTVFERYGAALKPMAVISFTGPGMPLIYSGQEAGLEKRLRFFEKDTIPWKNTEWTEFYTKLISLKHTQAALHNGNQESWQNLETTKPEQVLAFSMQKEESLVLVLTNLFDSTVQVSINPPGAPHTKFTEYFTGDEMLIDASTTFELQPYGYKILVSNQGL